MKLHFTPKQVASALKVSESSIKRWCDDSALKSTKTKGGHRRITLSQVLAYVSDFDLKLVAPEALGLPANSRDSELSLRRGQEHMREALTTGDEVKARAIAINLYLAKHSLTTIFDLVLAPAINSFGNRWQNGEISIYQERRACLIAKQAIDDLRRMVAGPLTGNKKAVGATLECDPYELPTAMIEVVLRDLGWEAYNLGVNLPASSILEAIERERPQLVWISVCSLPANDLGTRLARIAAACAMVETKLVVGGRTLPVSTREQLSNATFCKNLKDLSMYVGKQETH